MVNEKTVMNNHDFAFATANQTAGLAITVTETLNGASQGVISMAPRQAEELKQFVDVFRQQLETAVERLKQSQSDADAQLLATRCFELDEAVRFIQQSFIDPRKFGSERQILEAADWLCVEGFRMFVEESSEQPVGPLVAIESSYSPVIWPPDAKLPIPALFKVKPKRIGRAEHLPEFPVICLPGHLARQPDLLPLLSHEVGHAVDFAKNITANILATIDKSDLQEYWIAWMREIVADAVGVTISGEAFLVALVRYLEVLPPFSTVRNDYPYPPNLLRYVFVGDMLKELDSKVSLTKWIPQDSKVATLGDPAQVLLQGFRLHVLPALRKFVFKFNSTWLAESEQLQKFALKLATQQETTKLDVNQLPFRLLPSAVAIASQLEPWTKNQLEPVSCFRDLHSKASTGKLGWVGGATKWVFSEEHLPALRPTLLGGEDGNFKIPPLMLLTTHQKIAFIGATNFQLAQQLELAFAARDSQPWDELLIFYADETLLKTVELSDNAKNLSLDEELERMRESLQRNKWATKWSLHKFNGPALFGSCWDWEKQGGRIHISPALLGTEIGRCPAEDLVWQREQSSQRFSSYVKHFESLLEVAERVTSN